MGTIDRWLFDLDVCVLWPEHDFLFLEPGVFAKVSEDWF